MNAVWKIFLSMSVSGGLLILALLLGKRLLKDKLSRQWQYYIWLVAILRLLLPFGPEESLLGSACQALDQAAVQAAPLPEPQSRPDTPEDVLTPAGDLERDSEPENAPVEDLTAAGPLQEIGTLLARHVWLIWLAGALGLLIRKVTIYQGFIRYIKAGLAPVSDLETLDRLSIAAERAGVKKPVELCVNPLISSPLLIGLFRPCIVLPGADSSEQDFHYIVLHELTHYKRRDMLYKWLVQITLCLHWFNPLVHLMSREITKACEFSCDEAVLENMGSDSARDYGKTLLDAMAAVGKYRENLGAVTLSENKQLLKERLDAIMRFKKRSAAIRILTGVLTLCMILGAAFIGVYPADASGQTAVKSRVLESRTPVSSPPAGSPPVSNPPAQAGVDASRRDYAAQTERYYEAGSLPLFQTVFPRLDGDTQAKWLDRIYADGKLAFMGAAVNQLDEDCEAVLHLAETVYQNGDIAFFSTLAANMSEGTLEAWLDRALEDGNWAFQSMLFNALDRGDEFDELKDKRDKEWEAAQKAEYEAAGVTMVDEKTYYYQGQLVNIFLDLRSNKAFYTLNINPEGTVNVKIIRDANNNITGAAYMTQAEVEELLGDLYGPDGDDWDDEPEKVLDGASVSIPVDLETIPAGGSVFLGEYTLSEGDRIWYDISAERGNRMRIFFAEDEQSQPVYWSVNNLRQPGEELRCEAHFTVGSPAKPGTYRLYLQAPDGALGNVKGRAAITPAEAS